MSATFAKLNRILPFSLPFWRYREEKLLWERVWSNPSPPLRFFERATKQAAATKDTAAKNAAAPSPFTPELAELDGWWNHRQTPPPWSAGMFHPIEEKALVAELEKGLRLGKFPKPEIPVDIARASDIMAIPEFNFNLVASLVNRVPAVAEGITRAAGSVHFGRDRAPGTLAAALPRLGRANIKAIAFFMAVPASFQRGSLFRDLALDITEHSLVVAEIAAYLAKYCQQDADAAYLAGLVHDVGKFAVLKAIEQRRELPPEIPGGVDEGKLRLPLSLHEGAGRRFAGKWRLDERLVLAIAHHHDYRRLDLTFWGGEDIRLCALVNFSDMAARILGHGQPAPSCNLLESPEAKELGVTRANNGVEILEDIPGLLNSPGRAATANQPFAA